MNNPMMLRKMVRGILEWMDFLNNKKDNYAFRKCLKFSLRVFSDIQLQEVEMFVVDNSYSVYEAIDLLCGITHSLYLFL